MDVKSPKSNMYKFLTANALGCILYGVFTSSLPSVFFGVAGGVMVHVMNNLNNSTERDNLRTAVETVYNASDDYWRAALGMLHEKRSEVYD